MAGIPYYSIVPCCPGLGTQLNYFNFPTGDTIPGAGTYIYNGLTTTVNGITFQTGQCYTVTQSGVSFTFYPQAPAGSDFLNAVNCNNSEICDPCQKLTQCYTLYPCSPDNPILVTNSETAEGFENEFVSLFGYPGCYYVQPNTLGNCIGAQDIRVNGEAPCTCGLNCYIITGNPTSVTYVNELNELAIMRGGGQICSAIAPVVTGGIQGNVYNLGPCENNACATFCFLLTSCTTAQTITASFSTTLLEHYTNNEVIKVNGYDDCWSITQTEVCDCAVDLTILQSFADCPSCLPIVAYKFTKCNNTSVVKYSVDDFSAYVGKTVQLDCGDCWSVEQINFVPPSTSVITILFTFDSCTACNRIYYKLTDCTNLSNVQYTYTNLSSYLGKVIKIQGCDECFEIEETRLPINAGIVTVTESFDDCVACGALAPCICTTVKNYATIRQVYNYIDCNGALQTITVEPGDKSDKLCMRGFIGDKLCNCIELYINNELHTAVLQPEQVNGKPTWTFMYNTYQYNIVYDTNEGWQIVSSVFGLVAELNNPMLECPAGPWTIVKNSVVNVAVYLDNGTLLLEGPLVYNSTTNSYEGNITTLIDGNTYLFRLQVTYFNECNGVWQLSYWNTDLPDPEWTFLAGIPADCTCLNGTYIDVTPSNLYLEFNSFCTIDTEDCSIGYAPFVPAPTDDIKEYGDCEVSGTVGCTSYVITIPIIIFGPQTLFYKDCNGVVQQQKFPVSKNTVTYTICGEADQTSEDIYLTGPYTVQIEKGPKCGSSDLYTCPPPTYPKRFIRPGYFTPHCDTEKYEKFACKSSEILYKIVLEKRYGITNCCPDTDLGQRWIVKKELADLQGALDPNYTCTPAGTCCNNTPTCGCGCNSAPKTCKS